MAALDTRPPPFPLRSGRYQYRWWHTDDDGQRRAAARAPIGKELSLPDLINTAYRNADGSRTVFGLAFDFDAHRADARWLDAECRLDWPRISAYLADTHPEVYHQIAYAVRSTGGKGLGLVLAINPLPMQKSTEGNQRALINLQSRLIIFFDALGFGADPGARGLERDLPNFQDPGRNLHDNRLALRRAEESNEGVATKLHAYLNVLAAAERRERRIYNDARAEPGLARLVAWLLGAYDPGRSIWVPSFLSGESVQASTKTLVLITGLCAQFLRGYLKDPPAWLEATYLGRDEGWRLRFPLGRAVQRLLPRAEALLAAADKIGAAPSHQPRRILFSVAAIKEPQLVRHGDHNAWVTALALAYKWHGYSREEALAKIQLRSAALPEGASSSTCREIRSIVRTLYKNVPQTFGRFSGRDLPEWMTDDNRFVFGEKLSVRGGIAPGSSGGGGVVMAGKAVTLPKPAGGADDAAAVRIREINRQMSLKPFSLTVAESLTAHTTAAFDGVSAASGKDSCEKPSSWLEAAPGLALRLASTSPEVNAQSRNPAADGVTFTAIRWRQRIGIFDGDRLVVCFTKRHYRASAALDFLARRPEYSCAALRIYTPHLTAQKRYHSAIDAAPHVLVSGTVLGLKGTYAEKYAAWETDRGIQRDDLGAGQVDVPF